MAKYFDKLIYISHPESYHHYTMSFSARQLAKMLNIPCLIFHHLDEWQKLDYNKNIVILDGFLFTTHKLLGGAEFYRFLFPNSTLIVFGSDTVNRENYIDYSNPELIDIHLDTSHSVVKEYNNRGLNAKFFIWSASQTLLDYIEGFCPNIDFESKKNDFVYMANIKKFYQPYLPPNTKDRINLVSGLLNAGYSIKYNLGLSHIDDISLVYKKSWFSLGSTCPSYDLERNGKGFRDWIAPHLGTVLIYDDWEPYRLIFKNIVPMYQYGNINTIIDIVNRLKNNKDEYISIVNKQKIWIENNTIEKQIHRVINNKEVLNVN